MSNIILSAFSDEYSDIFTEQLEGMKGFGINNIELRHADGKNVSEMTEADVEKLKAALDKYAVGVSAIGSPIGKVTLDSDLEAHFKTAERVFKTASTLGAKFVRIFSFYAPEGKDITEMKDEVTAALRRLLDLAKKYGVTLCHENEANIYGATPARCRELLDYFGGELKCVFDMGNFVLENEKPFPDAYELLKDYIAYFHIKDALYEGAVVPPGKGDANVENILKAHMASTDKDFFITLEPHLQTFSGLNALVGRSFDNPYKYENAKAAFTDAVNKLRELI